MENYSPYLTCQSHRREKEKKELEHELIQNLKDRNDSLAKKVLLMMEEIKEFKNNKETIIPLKM